MVLDEGFDQAWRRLGLVIDRMGFELVDRDRTAGWYLVRYLDPAYEAKVKESRGFFANVFGSDEAIEAPTYRLHLGDEVASRHQSIIGFMGESCMAPLPLKGQLDFTGTSKEVPLLSGNITNFEIRPHMKSVKFIWQPIAKSIVSWSEIP